MESEKVKYSLFFVMWCVLDTMKQDIEADNWTRLASVKEVSTISSFCLPIWNILRVVPVLKYRTKHFVAAGILVFGIQASLLAQDRAKSDKGEDILDTPLEDLMKVDITDAFKSPIPLMRVPAAIYVVNQETIHRSGVKTLPEALRLVPGVEVSRIGNVYYTVSIRGFGNYLASNKILVLMDGRTLYSPYQNTVYWEIEDVMMDDIDRIEVILGPGGSLWGANAVNGVINVISKHSKDTKGGLVVQSLGDLTKNETAFRFGDRISDDSTFRVYGKYSVRHASDNSDRTSFGDGNSLNTLGFRTDSMLPKNSTLMVEGELAQYRITEDQPVGLVTPPYNVTYTNTDLARTSHLLGKWTKDEEKQGQTSVQAYYDVIDYPYTDQGSRAELFDLQVERRAPLINQQEVAYGGGYRYMVNDGLAGPSQTLIPLRRRDTITNGFIQDIFHLNRLDSLTVGMKIEHNDVSGFEYQPNVRYSHIPNDHQTFWASVGKADRTPSQSELNTFSIVSVTPPSGGQPLPVATTDIGSPDLKPETVVSNEIGYRQKLSEKESFEVQAYYNFYNSLIYLAPGAQFTSSLFGSPVVIDPLYFKNGDSGQTYGGEVSYRLSLSSSLQGDAAFTVLERSHFVQGSELAGPHYQASWHLGWKPSAKLDLDARLHWDDAIFESGVPANLKLDLHLNWRLSDKDEFSLGGYDLLTPRHYEFQFGSYIQRSFSLEYRRRF